MESIIKSLLSEIETRSKNKLSLIIAIDGRCASGKSTLAKRLQSELPCNLIHMDHFFLRPEQRTKERSDEPGGNVDYERFLEEVLIPLTSGEDVTYRPFDCQIMDFSEAVHLPPLPLTIIEGSYSCHPKLRKHHDLKVFLTISSDEQIRRIRSRNGDEHTLDFISKWIPLEERYFEHCHVRDCCDLIYGND